MISNVVEFLKIRKYSSIYTENNSLFTFSSSQDTGEVLCDATPVKGATDAIYDERGYL